jgi:hypothetical protein
MTDVVAAAARLVERSCAAQDVPTTVTDATALRRIGVVVVASRNDEGRADSPADAHTSKPALA